MTGRQQWGAVGGVLTALGLVFIIANHFIGREFALVTIGSRAPDFHAVTVGAPRPQGKTIRDYRGQVVLLNIWATWCVPCRVEMPSIEALQRAYGSRGLHIVAVSVDNPGTDAGIQSFVRKYGLTFEILHDTTAALTRDSARLPADVERAYQTTGVPETFVIARDGVIRKKVIGADDWGSPGNQALIAQLLREPGA
jgi:cytochrome c biogenesis protein CcmG, thiol:disulfide interchange protein DsbE